MPRARAAGRLASFLRHSLRVPDLDRALFKVLCDLDEDLRHPQQGRIDLGVGTRSQPTRPL